MRFILAAAAAAALVMATPASAQYPGGVGVQAGPFHFRVGSRYDGRWRDRQWRRGDRDYGFAGDCRVTRERIVTPSGRVIRKSSRVCG